MAKKTNAEKFPIPVKAGSTVVKIYRDRRPDGRVYFRVVFHMENKRQRLLFSDLAEAKTEASAKAAQLARGDLDATQLNGKDRLTYGRALDAIKAFDIPLDAAAIEYAETRKILKGHSPIESARFFMRHHGEGITGRKVLDAYEDFKKSKTDAKRSAIYLKDLGYRVGTFAKAFSVEVRQLTPQDVSDWLAGLKVSARSFNNFTLALRTFFKFCQKRQWLSKESDLLAQVERRSGGGSEIEIFTPAELRAILAAASSRVATCIAIQAFAGVRTAELFRLSWGNIDRRKGHIEISAGQAKTASRRLIPITENLASWLRKATRGGDKVWPVTASEYYEGQVEAAKQAEAAAVESAKENPKAKKRAKIVWKSNALRHSFISYRMAVTQDVAKVALEAGNSSKVIFQNYRELVTPEEANEWFAILPAGAAKNVTSISSAQG